MKGYVQTPPNVVDSMVEKLFANKLPQADSRILYPGSGKGDFAEGIIRWCEKNQTKLPIIDMVEINPKLVDISKQKLKGYPSVQFFHRNFLTQDEYFYEYIIGNPPYVPITEINEEEKDLYRQKFNTSTGRFDLYFLFFEKAMNMLKEDGRLVFVTPEKFTYVESAKSLRKILTKKDIREIEFIPENSFPNKITYPVITTIENCPRKGSTRILYRDRNAKMVKLSLDGKSWLPIMYEGFEINSESKLKEVCIRISCGVATGKDEIFIIPDDELNEELGPYAHPTIAGRDLEYDTETFQTNSSILIPYDRDGNLLDFKKLGALGDYLTKPEIKSRLEQRTCVNREKAPKPWYAFHETPPMKDILKEKLVCKDITSKPDFWIDREGCVVPRHSVYYLIPKNPEKIDNIFEYLQSVEVKGWLFSHCQRAHNGFIRLQSKILQELPIPKKIYAKLM